MINLYQLRLFLMVMESGTFSGAASTLHMTQPAISMQIRTLENHYGVKLFNRQGQHLELTDAGQALLEPARRLLALAQEVEEGWNVGPGVLRGKLNLVYSSNTANALYLLPPLLAGFRAQAQAVQFSLQTVSEETALQMLLNFQAHFALVSSAPRQKTIEGVLLDSDPLVLATPPTHPWQGQTVELAALRGQTMVQHAIGSDTRRLSDLALRAGGVNSSDVIIVGEVDSVQAAAELVRHGLGLAFLHEQLAHQLPDLGIAHLQLPSPETEQLLRRESWLVRYAPPPERAPSPVQQHFWQFALNHQTIV